MEKRTVARAMIYSVYVIFIVYITIIPFIVNRAIYNRLHNMNLGVVQTSARELMEKELKRRKMISCYIESKRQENHKKTLESKIELEAEESIEEEIATNYIKMEDVEISRDMDLSIRCGVSKEDFVTSLQELKYDYSGFLGENSELIYDLCEEYELNEIFFTGLIAAESGWEITKGHRKANNYISMMSSGGLKKFSSVEVGLEEAAKHLHEKYLTEGGKYYHGKTLAGVKVCFCSEFDTWIDLVYGCMKKVVE